MQSSKKIYSESCNQNRDPILDVLRNEFADPGTVLEIGSGTGQHAAYFPKYLTHISWQPTDVFDNIPSIEAWRIDAALSNVKTTLELNVFNLPWSLDPVDYIFSANTAHIISLEGVQCMFEGVGNTLKPGGLFLLYGPINYHGNYTSESNARFDQWLKARDPLSSIRDKEMLVEFGRSEHMDCIRDYEMPVNNRIIVFQKIDTSAP